MSLRNFKLVKKKLTGWANYPQCDSSVAYPTTLEELKTLVSEKNIIARGNARSYGDSSISKSITVDMKNFCNIIDLNDGIWMAMQLTAIINAVFEEYQYLAVTAIAMIDFDFINWDCGCSRNHSLINNEWHGI